MLVSDPQIAGASVCGRLRVRCCEHLDLAAVITMSQALSGDKLLNTLLSHTNIVGIFVWDFDGRILQANDAFLRIVGYEREDLVAGRMRWSDLTPPDLLDRQAERIREHQTTGRMQPFEKEYFRKDGTRVPVLVGVSRFEEQGHQGVGFVLDLSEHKRAEAEHRAHVWFLESLDRINRTMQAASDLERMMSDVLEAVLEVLSCDRAWLVYPCDPHAASWRVVMERTRPQFPGGFALQSDLPTDAGVVAGFAAARAASGAVLEVPAVVAERFAVRSRMAMAVYPKGDAPYLFGVHQCSRARAWTADEQRLFEEIGRRLTDALSNLVAFRSLRREERGRDHRHRRAADGLHQLHLQPGGAEEGDRPDLVDAGLRRLPARRDHRDLPGIQEARGAAPGHRRDPERGTGVEQPPARSGARAAARRRRGVSRDHDGSAVDQPQRRERATATWCSTKARGRPAAAARSC